ncbi:Holliday junction resolvase RuvX [Pelagicoccus sp. NFK12]|uniref:Putative pre-16S rRNA nuclease n=1 Tax=Pelagicoccus enzymogenes TaxID=2773457 RepID=A0A927II27_9BACT|nr:Holliday junction resolvase RuvX [Pelagicoccus enzymogenes]MBD5780313.1 Holliday junction resolvase RuvX [Pelagicoccus enzymogenes]MDQ8197784.1 Holliday junction resolvase RuvX [Pelagicoccus enzymogenes]
MRCIGVDYGERRVGVAYGDEIGVATPLPAIVKGTEGERIDALVALAKERRATDFVFGYPYNMDGSVGFKAKEVDAFIGKLLEKIELPVHRLDERLTSVEASKAFPKGRDDDLRRSGKIDSVAASLILQDYLNQNIELPEYDPYSEFDDGGGFR